MEMEADCDYFRKRYDSVISENSELQSAATKLVDEVSQLKNFDFEFKRDLNVEKKELEWRLEKLTQDSQSQITD
jgi:uncharacterized protein YlxW (UPF0749 family)